jgi:hypothetical protein
MQKLVETRLIEIDEKVTGGVKLPRTMILYTVDADHFVIAAKPLKILEDDALTKMHVSVAHQGNKNVVKLPSKIYNFYHLDESDCTIMTSSRDPTTITITV